MSETQENLLDEPMETLAAEEAAEKESNPEVIEDVLVEAPEPAMDQSISTTAEEEDPPAVSFFPVEVSSSSSSSSARVVSMSSPPLALFSFLFVVPSRLGTA